MWNKDIKKIHNSKTMANLHSKTNVLKNVVDDLNTNRLLYIDITNKQMNFLHELCECMTTQEIN